MASRKQTCLATVNTVLRALGGARNVARLTGAGHTSICNWRADERFPARYFLVMNTALEARGYTARHSLWGQEGNHELAA